MGARRFTLQPPAPFRLDLTVWALRRRPHNAIDRWDGQTWRRSLRAGDDVVGLAVTQTRTVGIHLLNRLAGLLGSAPTETDQPAAFPTADALAGADLDALRGLGFSRAKARTLVLLGRHVTSGAVDLPALEELDDGAARDLLRALPGIGRWSAEYTLLRGLGRLQVLPGDDVGARNSLHRRFGLPADAGHDAVATLTRRWWPYGGLVYFHLLLDRLANEGSLASPPTGRRRSSPP